MPRHILDKVAALNDLIRREMYDLNIFKRDEILIKNCGASRLEIETMDLVLHTQVWQVYMLNSPDSRGVGNRLTRMQPHGGVDHELIRTNLESV